jgi:hypothetical protein
VSGGFIAEHDEEWVPLGLKVLKEHARIWNVDGIMLNAPSMTTWLVPYDYEAIMRYGHAVNSAIPEDTNEAEFPSEPWANQVVLRIKSVSTGPKSVDGPIAGWR